MRPFKLSAATPVLIAALSLLSLTAAGWAEDAPEESLAPQHLHAVEKAATVTHWIMWGTFAACGAALLLLLVRLAWTQRAGKMREKAEIFADIKRTHQAENDAAEEYLNRRGYTARSRFKAANQLAPPPTKRVVISRFTVYALVILAAVTLAVAVRLHLFNMGLHDLPTWWPDWLTPGARLE